MKAADAVTVRTRGRSSGGHRVLNPGRIIELAEYDSSTWRDVERERWQWEKSFNLTGPPWPGSLSLTLRSPGSPPPPSILKPQSPTRPSRTSCVLLRASKRQRPSNTVYDPLYVSIDAWRTGEPFPRAACGPADVDTNRRPAIGCIRTAGILDGRVATRSFILTLSRP